MTTWWEEQARRWLGLRGETVRKWSGTEMVFTGGEDGTPAWFSHPGAALETRLLRSRIARSAAAILGLCAAGTAVAAAGCGDRTRPEPTPFSKVLYQSTPTPVVRVAWVGGHAMKVESAKLSRMGDKLEITLYTTGPKGTVTNEAHQNCVSFPAPKGPRPAKFVDGAPRRDGAPFALDPSYDIVHAECPRVRVR